MAYWFAECKTKASNRNLGEFLIRLGADETDECERTDTKGKKHLVWHLRPEVVTRLREFKRTDDDGVLHQFNFFVSVSDNFNGKIKSASFIEKRYKPKKVKQAEDKLRQHVEKCSWKNKFPY